MSATITDAAENGTPMIRHAFALILCTLFSAAVCGAIGEAVWPSGPYALVSASMWLAGVAGIVAPVAYVVTALARHDARLLRKDADGAGDKKRSTIRPIALITCIVTIVATFSLVMALRLGWFG